MGFKDLELEFSPGVSVFIGANRAGKTHLMSLVYSARGSVGDSEEKLSEKARRVLSSARWARHSLDWSGAGDRTRVRLSDQS